MSKYLVTGGAGFIGSHIVEALIDANHDVVVLDNLSSGHKENLSKVWRRIRFIEGDIRDPETCGKASEGCDGVFHEAALVSVADSVERPRDNHEINITGTVNVLEAARGNGVKRIVFASSAAIYGDNPELPKNEMMLPEPQSPYAVAKITGEYYLKTYAELYGLECVALRYFNVYGPRQDPSSPYSGVISIFSQRVGRGLPITIYGDGEQTRDFVNIADVVSANLLAMGVGVFEAGGFPSAFSVFNVATGKQHSLLDLLDTLEEISIQKVSRTFAKARAGDIRHSFASNETLKNVGWIPSINFKAGLAELMSLGSL
ncbi:NAD-dependent epimerase/dehydratase family protein [bacterium]|nr:NAD-dependent epimerase/dehydratase family protein [bacterium]